MLFTDAICAADERSVARDDAILTAAGNQKKYSPALTGSRKECDYSLITFLSALTFFA
jgi:hypothetical protein